MQALEFSVYLRSLTTSVYVKSVNNMKSDRWMWCTCRICCDFCLYQKLQSSSCPFEIGEMSPLVSVLVRVVTISGR